MPEAAPSPSLPAAARAPRAERRFSPLYRFLRALSFTNSIVYACLLFFWLARGFEPETNVFGWLHGCMWIVLTVLSLVAVRLRQMPFWLAVLVAVIGGVGPFAGSIGFIVDARRRTPGASA